MISPLYDTVESTVIGGVSYILANSVNAPHQCLFIESVHNGDQVDEFLHELSLKDRWLPIEDLKNGVVYRRTYIVEREKMLADWADINGYAYNSLAASYWIAKAHVENISRAKERAYLTRALWYDRIAVEHLMKLDAQGQYRATDKYIGLIDARVSHPYTY